MDCSKQYYVEILPNIGVNVTITQVIQYCLYERAKCLDDEGFTDTINVLIGIFVSIAMVGMVLGSLEVWLFQTACERQVSCVTYICTQSSKTEVNPSTNRLGFL